MQDFNDRSGTALVIGGTGGIGSEICKLLAARGSDIAFTYQNNEEKAESLSTEIENLGVNSLKHSLDLDNQAEVHNFIQSLGNDRGIHTQIYAAGPVVPQVHLSNIPPETFSEHLNSEVNAFFGAVIPALPFIREQNGAIIAVTSAATDKYPIKDG